MSIYREHPDWYTRSSQGRTYYSVRDNRGRFAHREDINYRAVVTLNSVPIHSTPYNPQYHNYTMTKIDKIGNINLKDMKKALLKYVGTCLHFDARDFWFEVEDDDVWNVEEPRPYPYGEISETFEEGESE
jgi:alpha-galactosidase